MSKKRKIIIAIVAAAILLAVGLTCVLAVTLHKRQEREQHKQAVQAYRDAKFAIYGSENEKYADYEVDVAFLGDSLTDLYDLEKYYPQYLTANRGIGGDTTFDLEDRLGLSVYELKPKVAVMLIGVNNIDSMLDNYERILKGLRDNLPDTEIVLLSLTSMSGTWGLNNHLAAYNNVHIKLLAEKYGLEYVDLYSALLNPKTGEIHAEYTIDGCHLTPAGYEAVTDAVTPTLEKLLGK